MLGLVQEEEGGSRPEWRAFGARPPPPSLNPSDPPAPLLQTSAPLAPTDLAIFGRFPMSGVLFPTSGLLPPSLPQPNPFPPYNASVSFSPWGGGLQGGASARDTR